ncbi:MAG: hypothetical protein EBY34_00265, partial [Alphaproteobacteria bacterium]|nr:hypothetical protein [Alphaproteobacteria bacterium]
MIDLIACGAIPVGLNLICRYWRPWALAARSLKPEDVPIYFVQGRFSIKEWTDVLRAKLAAMPDLKLIIVDSLQAFFEGDNDNDNTQMVEMAH